MVLFVVPNNRELFRTQLNYFSSLTSAKTTWEITLKDDKRNPFPAEITVTQNINSVNNQTQLFWMIRDISDRKRAEQELLQLNQSLETKVTERTQELRQVNQLLQTVLDAFPMSVFWKDRQSIILGCNQLFAITCGMNSHLEAIGKSDFDLACTEDEALTYVADDQQVMESGLPKLNIEEKITLSSGEQQWLQTNKIPLRDAEGNVIGLMGTFQDISDRKQVELALAQKEHQLQELANASPSVIYSIVQTLNGAPYFEYLSPACEKIHELTVAEAYQNSALIFEQMHPDDLQGYGDVIEQSLKTLQPFSYEWRIITNSGTKWLRGDSLPSPRENGDVVWHGVVTDISDRKQAEIQLKLANQELLRATRLKDEFLANMSHELRTPLTAILGMSEALQENTFGEINPRQENAIKLIEKSGRHLLELINDILDLSKIEAGKLELEFSSAPINILCENSTILVKQIAFSKNIQLHTRIAQNISQIWVDERRIRQALINLLSNAIKFTASGGQVTLVVELEGPEIVFSVTDTGIGIAPENLDKLFQPFVQIDSNLSRQYAGTGLGLALVQRIVTGHGGTVSVTSTLGEGSCFAVRLPYTPSLSVVNPLLESGEVRSTLTNLPHSLPSLMPLILIADDDEGNIQTMEDYLGHKGYQMLLAYNGIEAVEMTKIHKPDLILMDIQMPLLDGLQATAQIRSDPAIAHIPIIALTALALPGDEARCFAAGVNEYLVKPVRFKLLIEMIQKFYQN